MLSRISTHPDPQFERDSFMSLNGEWSFGFRKAVRGYSFITDEKDILKFYEKAQYTHIINVPYCIESVLSGIGYTDFVNAVWYRREIKINRNNKRVFIHFSAADYITSLVVNGQYVGLHKGGYTSFSFDITDYVKDGSNEIFVLCQDDTRASLVPSGKQSVRKESYACSYTRTTGIWQSVYLEFTPDSYVKSFKLYPDIEQSKLTVNLSLAGRGALSCKAFYDGREVGTVAVDNAVDNLFVQLELDELHLWEVGNGRLYELEISFGDDIVRSYFGMRNVRLDGYRFMLNNKSVFQRLVLDQGFYKEGIYTARNDEELKQDIVLSMALGFNGARLHQKVFDPRFLYFCDLYGYMVWGEYANWGLDYSNPKAVDVFLSEWGEAIERDFNHPSIIGWCPFNETWNYRGRKQYAPLLSTVYDYTKAVDTTRPCIDTSGNFHIKTDIYDVHDYRFDTREFKASYDKLVTENYLYEHVLLDNPGRQKYNGEPTFVSEYGGIKWAGDKSVKSWGYGDDVKTPDEFVERYAGLTSALINNEKMLGFCYTQLYDVEQEQNGLYTYERKKKFDDSVYEQIRAINITKAKIED